MMKIMNKKKNGPQAAAELRRRAEEIARGKAALSPEYLDARSSEETRQALHELLVHQIELEMQNEELRRAQAELDAARARYFDLYELAPVGYCTVSEQGLILETNLTAVTLLGVPRGALVKQPISRFILKEDHDIYYLHRKQLFETGAPQVCELRLVKKDGSQFWARFEATVAQDGENGNTVCRVVMSDITKRKRAEVALQQAHAELEQRVAERTKELRQVNEELRTEITERKRAEEARRESEANFRNMADQLVDVLFATDNSAFITFISPSALQVFGLQPEDMVGRNFIEFLSDTEIPCAVTKFKDARASGQSIQNLPFVMKRKDGSTFTGELNSSVIWKDGRTAGTIGIIRDITERKLAEEALKESEERYRTQVESINDVAYAVGGGGEITYISPVAKDVLGYEPDEITGRHFLEFVHQEDIDLLKRKFAELRDGVISRDEYRVIGKHGDIKWVRTLTTPIIDIDGFAGGRGILVDMTDRKQAEEALHRAEENFRRSLDESPLGVRIVTVKGETIYANRAILDIYGYDSVEELKTTPVKKRYTPESYAEFRIRRKKRRQGDDPSEYEISIVRKGGEICCLRVLRNTILWNGERQFQVIYNDITERMRAEKTLRESEERFRKLADSTWEGIIIHKEGVIIDVNESLLKMIGFHLEEVIGKSFIDFLAPESIESALQKLREGTTHDQLYLEVKGLRKDNTVFSAEALGRPIRYKNLDARVIAVRDITLRKRAEENLRESEERYRSLFKNNHAVMLLIDPDSAAIIDANPAACTYYGWSREELMKRRIDEINTLRRKEVAAEMQLARAEKRNHFFFKHRRADGTIRDVEVYSGPIILKGKALLYSIVHDITDRKQAEEKLAVESHHLAETNTALRVLLQRREEDQKEIERKILANIKKLVLPNLEKLRSLKLNDIQATCLDIAAANLQQVISPFMQNLTARFADFTPREIEVANMIREGKTSKEIANIFNTSIGNVDFHRDNIRKKLGLSHKKSNLRTFLMKLSEK